MTIKKKNKSTITSFLIGDIALKAVRKFSRKLGVNKSEYFRIAIAERIEKDEQQVNAGV